MQELAPNRREVMYARGPSIGSAKTASMMAWRRWVRSASANGSVQSVKTGDTTMGPRIVPTAQAMTSWLLSPVSPASAAIHGPASNDRPLVRRHRSRPPRGPPDGPSRSPGRQNSRAPLRMPTYGQPARGTSDPTSQVDTFRGQSKADHCGTMVVYHRKTRTNSCRR
jgi:hypothetical protein